MKKTIFSRFTSLLLILGILLVLASGFLLVYDMHKLKADVKNAEQLTQRLSELIPKETEPLPVHSRNMPAFELNGMDFVGIIKVPAYSVTLPIHNTYDAKISQKLPCRYEGSAYDNSLVVVSSDRTLNCAEQLSTGDAISITDMRGASFEYTIAAIDRKQSYDISKISNQHDALLLIIGLSNSMDSLIVYCK